MTEKKRKNPFVQGPVSPAFVADVIAAHAQKTEAGAHSIFLGQVRADVVENQTVVAIEYSAYAEMALEVYHQIRERLFAEYPLSCLHVHHSLGRVGVGQICLFVMTTSKHRAAAIDACSAMVEAIKKELPVFGKELFGENGHQWKVNQ